MVTELFTTGEKEFQTAAGSMHNAECLGHVTVNGCQWLIVVTGFFRRRQNEQIHEFKKSANSLTLE